MNGGKRGCRCIIVVNVASDGLDTGAVLAVGTA